MKSHSVNGCVVLSNSFPPLIDTEVKVGRIRSIRYQVLKKVNYIKMMCIFHNRIIS